jgi:hypothetical protein
VLVSWLILHLIISIGRVLLVAIWSTVAAVDQDALEVVATYVFALAISQTSR